MKRKHRLALVIALSALVLLMSVPQNASATQSVTRRFTTPYYDRYTSTSTTWTATAYASASKYTGKIAGKVSTSGWLDTAITRSKIQIRDTAPNFDSYVVVTVAYSLTYYQKALGWGANSKVQVQLRIDDDPWATFGYWTDLHYKYLGTIYPWVHADEYYSYSQSKVTTTNFQDTQELHDNPVPAGGTFYAVVLMNLVNNVGSYIAYSEGSEYFARCTVGYIEVTYHPWEQ